MAQESDRTKRSNNVQPPSSDGPQLETIVQELIHNAERSVLVGRCSDCGALLTSGTGSLCQECYDRATLEIAAAHGVGKILSDEWHEGAPTPSHPIWNALERAFDAKSPQDSIEDIYPIIDELNLYETLEVIDTANGQVAFERVDLPSTQRDRSWVIQWHEVNDSIFLRAFDGSDRHQYIDQAIDRLKQALQGPADQEIVRMAAESGLTTIASEEWDGDYPADGHPIWGALERTLDLKVPGESVEDVYAILTELDLNETLAIADTIDGESTFERIDLPFLDRDRSWLVQWNESSDSTFVDAFEGPEIDDRLAAATNRTLQSLTGLGEAPDDNTATAMPIDSGHEDERDEWSSHVAGAFLEWGSPPQPRTGVSTNPDESSNVNWQTQERSASAIPGSDSGSPIQTPESSISQDSNSLSLPSKTYSSPTYPLTGQPSIAMLCSYCGTHFTSADPRCPTCYRHIEQAAKNFRTAGLRMPSDLTELLNDRGEVPDTIPWLPVIVAGIIALAIAFVAFLIYWESGFWLILMFPTAMGAPAGFVGAVLAVNTNSLFRPYYWAIPIAIGAGAYCATFVFEYLYVIDLLVDYGYISDGSQFPFTDFLRIKAEEPFSLTRGSTTSEQIGDPNVSVSIWILEGAVAGVAGFLGWRKGVRVKHGQDEEWAS